ncbi:MAG: M43 family zinc metalloprotease [Flavipsychrobacter sp.]
MKNLLLFTALLFCLGETRAQMQPCATDEMYQKYKRQYPEINKYEAALNKEIAARLNVNRLPGHFMKTTASSDTAWFDIPVVVHVIHDYNAEYLPDDSIYHLINTLNRIYALQNDTSSVIAPFKKYVGKAYIRFHLATRDPLGNPTKGITRHYSYLTYGGDDMAKFDLWSPVNYYNIWFENKIGAGVANGEVLAYAVFPSQAAAYPYSDGVIGGYQFINFENTIPHETGHYFNLYHTWNSSGQACGVACGDDEVDDTPPTKGHPSICPMYDTVCANGYFKVYPSSIAGVDSLEDFPDTTNVQNIMDYSSCTVMFTAGQVARMRAALRSNVGGRNNLWTDSNLQNTGALEPMPDLPPVADFSVQNSAGLTSATSAVHYFQCTGKDFYFKDQSWGDTITALQWTFSNDASASSATSLAPVRVSFATPGWASVKLTATGNNSGSTTIVKDSAVYVADTRSTPPIGYYQEFNASADLKQWPILNYYRNGFKWEITNDNGYYDKSCIRYTGYDHRQFPATATGSPKGDFDDFYTPAFDLSAMSAGYCNLNFMYSGATRTNNSFYMTDTLEIDYSTNCGYSWNVLKKLTKADIASQGASSTEFAPQSTSEWKLQSIDIPSAARVNTVFFRFRYMPGGEDIYGQSTGNDFYMDRININNQALGLNTLASDKNSIALVPNPTSSAAYLVVNEAGNGVAEVTVTDIAGKVVYRTQQKLNGNTNRIEIPAANIAAKGMYLVQIVTPEQNHTEKLVVY